jgi:alpha-1,2-mannosidase, putative
MNPVTQVNLLQGTRSERDFSTGNTLPLIARPWGLHHWSLQTQQSPWMFHPEHRKLQGLRLTHQPSPWMDDYGNLLVTAFTGPFFEAIDHQASAYRLGEAVLHPHYFRTELLRYRVGLEMAPTGRGAVFRFHRRAAEALRVRLFFADAFEWGPTAQPRRFQGISRNFTGGVAGDFGLRFVAEFDAVPLRSVPVGNGCVFEFAPEVERLELRLAASFVSTELATVSLERELIGRPLEEIAADGEAVWNEHLSRISFAPRDERQARLFASCLYRCLLFPRFLDEHTADGRVVHYSPYDGAVHEGGLCADTGFWDTYRTLFPLLGLFYPETLRRMLDGWVNACREAGWSPKWPSPGPRNCMIGTHFNVVVADALARGVVDWNVEEAFSYLWKDATVPSDDPHFGRVGLEDYLRLGYVPADKYHHATSATLDYAYDDFCISRVARFLGREREAEELERRAKNYRHVFDPSVGFMRGRNADGSWREPFDEFEWGGPFIEGGPWQHTFHVPHDPAGLAALFGGNDALVRKLDAMFATPPHFTAGDYPCEIHEMTEMAMADFGQYAHSNQPVHHFLALYAQAGRPEKAVHWIHRVANELYTPDSFPGDEDNGEMAAWYVFACLGMFPLCPGTPDVFRFPGA